MENVTLQAEVRASRGKGPARRLRQAGLIPAVFYGASAEATAITINQKDVDQKLRGPYGKNVIFDLKVGEETHEVMLKTFQKDPIQRTIKHVDFYLIDYERPITIEVPIKLSGQAIGVKVGGRLQQVRRSVNVRCLPGSIPEALTFDVTDMDIKSRAMASSLPTPEGVELMLKNDFAFAQVKLPRGAAAAEETEAAEEA